MTIYIGSDHGEINLKKAIREWLKEKGIKVEDLGTHSEEKCDYPDFAKSVSEKVSGTENSGILICGTGIGMSMAANKVKGVRAAVVKDEYTGKMAKQHNNANVLCLGERSTDKEDALSAVKAWLEAEFEGGRHEKRVSKIHKIEDGE